MNIQPVENEIRAIPGNDLALDELYKLLESREAIALVGAGASAGLWPLWNEFLQGFIDYSLKCDKINQNEAEYFRKEAPQTPLETAQQLRNKIGDRLYFEYLRETFNDKISPQTGGAFTLTHRALMQLAIHNYVSLNYDAGLTNARAALYPRATTSYYFWDQEEARRIRDRNYKRQVLHAHGRFDRADSIILTLDDYRRAYDNRAFLRLLEDLFAFEKLLIVGFGMSDPYIKQLFNNISSDYKKSPLRHIAFVGLDDKDLQVTHLLRERVEMVYGSRILFYPTRNHHQALTDWLAMLAEKYAKATGSRTAEEIQPLATPPQLKTALPDKYIHQPTDDANFKGRVQDFATLNRWANDPATRMIAITGIGGQGKTAQVGRWLKQGRTPELARMPVFYWSFYEDLDVGKFLQQVVEFCLPIVRIHGKQESEPISFLLSVIRQGLLLVLDGLEVLQEEASSPTHGRINHPLLEQLLQQWLRYPHQGLMILTSRFRFPQLERYSGISFHHMNLVRLSTGDGIALLEKLGLRGEQKLMADYVEKLNGHPLALRVLASTVKRSNFGDLAQFEGKQILPAASDEDPLSQKLARLLNFYERQLKNGQRELLGIISLFKRPVEIKSFVILLGDMKSLQNTPLAKASATDIEKQLDLLIDDFLVEKTAEGITTHPVIRDYFRAGNKMAGSRPEVADFLQARPSAKWPQNIEEVRDLVEAVQLLCDEGEFKVADDLFQSRLAEGGYGFDVFRDLPAVAEGLECCMTFVIDENCQKKVHELLGESKLNLYFSYVSLYNHLLGNLAQSRGWWYKCLDIARKLRNKAQQAQALNEVSLVEKSMGIIRQGLETVNQSLCLSHETRDVLDFCVAFPHKAYYEFLLGNTITAYLDFETGLYYFQKHKTNAEFLIALAGNLQAEFLIRLDARNQFEALNAANMRHCKVGHMNRDLGQCHLLQGWYEISVGRLVRAEKSISAAEKILRPAGLPEYICRLNWIWALLAEAKEDYFRGLQKLEESLLTCADKGFRLWQADLMVLRGRLRLQQFQKENHQDNDLLEKTGDDGHETLKIAEQAGYIWAKVEALELLTAYHQTRVALPDFNAEDEKDFAQGYAKEAESIKAELFLSEEQMQGLQAQGRKEFETQIAGWEK